MIDYLERITEIERYSKNLYDAPVWKVWTETKDFLHCRTLSIGELITYLPHKDREEIFQLLETKIQVRHLSRLKCLTSPSL